MNSTQPEIYAVITGDIVNSTAVSLDARNELIFLIKESFEIVERKILSPMRTPLEFYRGDSFQAVLSKPEDALLATVYIHAKLRSGLKMADYKVPMNARIAIGIGTVDFWINNKVSESDGEAFRRSGPLLDKMKGEHKTLINTPWDQINNELEVESALLDAIINKWSMPQAEAISNYLLGINQETLARSLKITQPAIQQRLKASGWWAIGKLIKRYRTLISENISI